MKTTTSLLIAAALMCGSVTTGAFAQSKEEKEKIWEKEWRRFDPDKGQKDTKNGPNCQESLTSRGEGKVGLGITQIWAKLRTERHWSEAATKLYGAEYASWRKAKGKSVTCETKDAMLKCKATAYACK